MDNQSLKNDEVQFIEKNVQQIMNAQEDIKYRVHYPHNLKKGDRYSNEDGVHHLQILVDDLPFKIGSPTHPRCEMRFVNDYTTGFHSFEADFKIPLGTTGVTIMQVMGGNDKRATSLMMRVIDGTLRAYDDFILIDNIQVPLYGTWHHMKVTHDTATRIIMIYINEVYMTQIQDKGQDSHNFKCGVYQYQSSSPLMQIYYRNIVVDEMNVYPI